MTSHSDRPADDDFVFDDESPLQDSDLEGGSDTELFGDSDDDEFDSEPSAELPDDFLIEGDGDGDSDGEDEELDAEFAFEFDDDESGASDDSTTGSEFVLDGEGLDDPFLDEDLGEFVLEDLDDSELFSLPTDPGSVTADQPSLQVGVGGIEAEDFAADAFEFVDDESAEEESIESASEALVRESADPFSGEGGDSDEADFALEDDFEDELEEVAETGGSSTFGVGRQTEFAQLSESDDEDQNTAGAFDGGRFENLSLREDDGASDFAELRAEQAEEDGIGKSAAIDTDSDAESESLDSIFTAGHEEARGSGSGDDDLTRELFATPSEFSEDVFGAESEDDNLSAGERVAAIGDFELEVDEFEASELASVDEEDDIDFEVESLDEETAIESGTESFVLGAADEISPQRATDESDGDAEMDAELDGDSLDRSNTEFEAAFEADLEGEVDAETDEEFDSSYDDELVESVDSLLADTTDSEANESEMAWSDDLELVVVDGEDEELALDEDGRDFEDETFDGDDPIYGDEEEVEEAAELEEVALEAEFDEVPSAVATGSSSLRVIGSGRRLGGTWRAAAAAAIVLVAAGLGGVAVLEPAWLGLEPKPAFVDVTEVRRPRLALASTEPLLPPLAVVTEVPQPATTDPETGSESGTDTPPVVAVETPTDPSGEQPTGDPVTPVEMPDPDLPSDPTGPVAVGEPTDLPEPPSSTDPIDPFVDTSTDPGLSPVAVVPEPGNDVREAKPAFAFEPIRVGDALEIRELGRTMPAVVASVVLGDQALARLENASVFIGRVKRIEEAFVTLDLSPGEVSLRRSDLEVLVPVDLADAEGPTLAKGEVRLRNANRLVGRVVRPDGRNSVTVETEDTRIIVPLSQILDVRARMPGDATPVDESRPRR